MKGIVFTKFVETVEKEFGGTIVKDIIEKSFVPSGGDYKVSEDYIVFEMKVLFHQLGAVCDMPHWVLLKKMGSELFRGLFEAYPHLLNEKDLIPVTAPITAASGGGNPKSSIEDRNQQQASFSQKQFEAAADKLFHIFEKEPSNAIAIDWPSPLDAGQIEELYPDDLEHIQLIFQVFQEEMPKEMNRIQQAIIAGDWLFLGKIVHKIKPNFVMVGRKDIFDILEKLEFACGGENPDSGKIELLTKELRVEVKSTLSAVSNVLEQFRRVIKQ
jgi:HPt (histidine-containing phosphotransfer) domain-containing protein